MDNSLASASAIGDQRQKIEQYRHILSSVLASNDVSQSKKFIDHSTFSLLFVYLNFFENFDAKFFFFFWDFV